MKKKLNHIFIIIFLLFTLFSSGQIFEDSSVFLSLSVGLNMGKYKKEIKDFTSTNTYLPFLGVDLNKYYTEHILLSGGFGYSIRGSNSDVSSNAETYRFHYLYVEGLAKYKLTDFLHLTLGIQPSYLVKAKYKLSDSSANVSNSFPEFELSIPLGFEINLQKRVNIGVGYDIPNPMNSFNNFRLSINILLNQDQLPKKTNDKKINAYKKIKELKEGVLFIRLQSDQRKIETLIKQGNISEAEKVKIKADKRNKEIISAFKRYYNFCPVYFFYETRSNQILESKFMGAFINDSLTTDSTSIPSFLNFYVAEFGTLESSASDTSDHFTQGNSYSGGTYTGISALKMMDSHFIQLEEPFPFYVRMYQGTARRSYKEIVMLFNNRLVKFYENSIYFTNKQGK